MRFFKVMYVDPRIANSRSDDYIRSQFAHEIAKEIVEKYMTIKRETTGDYHAGVPMKQYTVTFDVFNQEELLRLFSQYQATGVL